MTLEMLTLASQGMRYRKQDIALQPSSMGRITVNYSFDLQSMGLIRRVWLFRSSSEVLRWWPPASMEKQR